MTEPELRDRAKRAAAEAAAALVENGMVLGLGSGSTANFFLEALAYRIRRETLQITGVPTSRRTENVASRLGIPITDLTAAVRIDLAIDGADEIERGSLALIKGAGGALLREKLVAVAAGRFIVIADDSKPVERLGIAMTLPVETVIFGHEQTARRLEKIGGRPALRRDAASAPFVSDSGNYIYDCSGFGPIEDATTLEARIKAIVGVVDCGLFVDLACEAIVGDASGVTHRLIRNA